MKSHKRFPLYPRFQYNYFKFVHNWLLVNDPETEVIINKAYEVDYSNNLLRRAKHSVKAQIGAAYEKQVAESYYNYAEGGWTIEFSGMNEQLEDMGRDLIATNEEKTVIIQCKCWAAPKVIHERHLFQLFGSTHLYRQEHPNENVSCTFFTSTILSEKAKSVADKLGIEYHEKVKLTR